MDEIDEIDERALVERLRAREEAAFNAFVRAHQERVFVLALRLLGDRAEAEDIAQEVFVAAFRAISSFRGDSKLSTWLHRITTNHCHNRNKYLARRARPTATDPSETIDRAVGDDPPPAGASAAIPRPDLLAEAHEIEAIVQRALDALEPDARELIVLRDIENLSYAEIVAVTGLPEGTVKSRLHRARVALEACVTEHEGRLEVVEGKPR